MTSSAHSPRFRCALLVLTFVAALSASGGAPAPGPVTIAATHRRCEYAVDPMGIDMPAPRLFWRLESSARGERQTAWQVLVSATKEGLAAGGGELWDSGRMESDESIHIRYAGAALASSQRVFWKVRVWDHDGRPSAWSGPATWTMGVLRPEDWKGTWVAAPAATEALVLRATWAQLHRVRQLRVRVALVGHSLRAWTSRSHHESVTRPAPVRRRRAVHRCSG